MSQNRVKGRILILDDDREMVSLLEDFLGAEGYLVAPFGQPMEALTALRPGGSLESASQAGDIDLIITDLKMGQMDGMQFLKTVKVDRPEIPVVLITAFGSIDTAIEAMRNGAYHYLVKPFKLAEMAVIVQRALERRQLTRENKGLREELRKEWGLEGIVGKSKPMQTVFDLVKRVAYSNANVLVTGESGSGKEMVARAIHSLSERKDQPLIAINCSAIPETLLESELFGHAKGSFTGATQRKRGLIEEANGGTLFLDEIGDMIPSLQAKLLRVLQERKIRPVGDNHFYEVDIRVISATHKDLKTAIREGAFREDLFYRLSVIPMTLPPLRDRPEDIPLLAEHFLKKASLRHRHGSQPRILGFTQEAIAKLCSMRWQGNVRELENVVERAVVLCPNSYIAVEDIDDQHQLSDSENAVSYLTQDLPTLGQLEQRYIQMVLQKTAGRKDKAAQILGINRRTLYRKEREYGWVKENEEIELESGEKP
jgi:two-component system, NtrC family, response regulator HydG